MKLLCPPRLLQNNAWLFLIFGVSVSWSGSFVCAILASQAPAYGEEIVFGADHTREEVQRFFQTLVCGAGALEALKETPRYRSPLSLLILCVVRCCEDKPTMSSFVFELALMHHCDNQPQRSAPVRPWRSNGTVLRVCFWRWFRPRQPCRGLPAGRERRTEHRCLRGCPLHPSRHSRPRG